ncbi:hypothetical protein J4466_03115 [Candidatus Pacearchaeota archaeon]|nr:hypothetical protein [Candidatus Pacearchaeota archaeon]
MTLKDKLVTSTLVLGFIGALTLPPNRDNTKDIQEIEKTKTGAQQAKDNVYDQFKDKADTNHDGHLIESELKNSYDTLSLKYDARKPDNLTEEQMKKYIDIKNKSSDYSY